jgi:hypothetical protein
MSWGADSSESGVDEDCPEELLDKESAPMPTAVFTSGWSKFFFRERNNSEVA